MKASDKAYCFDMATYDTVRLPNLLWPIYCPYGAFIPPYAYILGGMKIDQSGGT